MEGLAEAMASKPPLDRDMDGDFTFAENDGDDLRFRQSCLEELDRYRRTDEWLPSFHNILSRTALKCTRLLSTAGVIHANPSALIQYTRDGTADELRLTAFDNLFEMGLANNNAVLRWFLFAMGSDPSPYFRCHAFCLFGKILGNFAIGQKSDDSSTQQQDGLIIEQEESSTNARKADLARRTTVAGALAALKAEVQDNETFKSGIWTALSSPILSFHEIKDLLDICALLYEPNSSMVVKLKYPRYWQCKKVGKGQLRFSHTDRIRTTPTPTRVIAPPPPPLLLSHTSSSRSTVPSPGIKREDSSPSAAMLPPQRKLIFKPPRRPSEDQQGVVLPQAMPTPTPTTPVEGEKPRLKIKLKIGPPKTPASGK